MDDLLIERRRAGAGKLPYYYVVATLPAVVTAVLMQSADTRTAFILGTATLAVTALATSFAWHKLFAELRGRELDSGWLMHGWLFYLLIPTSLPLTHVALGVSIGVVIGSLVFGGTGRYLVSPALLGVIVLSISYPDAFSHAETALFWNQLKTVGLEGLTDKWSLLLFQESATLSGVSIAACGLGAAILYRSGAVSLRIVGGALAGSWLVALLFDLLGGTWHGLAYFPIYWHWLSAPFCFAVVFIATDPTAAPISPLGRWIYGGLIGALVVILRVTNPEHPEATLPACLLASLFAPLIDHCCLNAGLRRQNTENPHATRS